MPSKKKPHLNNKAPEIVKRKRKEKQPPQKTPMQPVQVMGPTGKLRMEWRPW